MHEIAQALRGARIQRIDGPFAGVIALTLHRHDRHGCLLLAATRTASWGWVTERPRGEPASSFVLLLRKHLEGEAIGEIRFTDDAIEIAALAVLRLEASPPNVVLAIEGEIAGALWGSPKPGRTAPFAADLAALERAGAAIVGDLGAARAALLARKIGQRRTKLERRVSAIDADVAKAAEAPALRARGSLLLASLGQINKGATEAIVTDWTADPPAKVAIAIDPRRGPKGEADALFKRAKKLDRGATIAGERREQTLREIAALDALVERIAGGDLDAVEREAARLGVRAQAEPGRASEPGARKPYRTFLGAGDRAIWVGRSAADNDELTLHIARPHHHWLHARGGAGSHVIVPLDRGASCPADLLIDAAHLAAHFSSLRGESPIEIAHTARRYVRKPRGSPPGMVSVSHEKTIVLRVEGERLAALLGREDHS